MIDPVWLQRFIAFGEADTDRRDATQLAALLDDPAEVLPYLIVHAQAFAHWPKARAALAQAGADTVRPAARPPGAQGAGAPLSTYRGELYNALRTTLLAHDVRADVSDARDDEPARLPIETVLTLARRVRLDEARGVDAPSMFISPD